MASSGKKMKLEDCFKLLGVPTTVDDVQLTTSYRKLALQLHPDKNPGNVRAAEDFIELCNAYESIKKHIMHGRSSNDDEDDEDDDGSWYTEDDEDDDYDDDDDDDGEYERNHHHQGRRNRYYSPFDHDEEMAAMFAYFIRMNGVRCQQHMPHFSFSFGGGKSSSRPMSYEEMYNDRMREKARTSEMNRRLREEAKLKELKKEREEKLKELEILKKRQAEQKAKALEREQQLQPVIHRCSRLTENVKRTFSNLQTYFNSSNGSNNSRGSEERAILHDALMDALNTGEQALAEVLPDKSHVITSKAGRQQLIQVIKSVHDYLAKREKDAKEAAKIAAANQQKAVKEDEKRKAKAAADAVAEKIRLEKEAAFKAKVDAYKQKEEERAVAAAIERSLRDTEAAKKTAAIEKKNSPRDKSNSIDAGKNSTSVEQPLQQTKQNLADSRESKKEDPSMPKSGGSSQFVLQNSASEISNNVHSSFSSVQNFGLPIQEALLNKPSLQKELVLPSPSFLQPSFDLKHAIGLDLTRDLLQPPQFQQQPSNGQLNSNWGFGLNPDFSVNSNFLNATPQQPLSSRVMTGLPLSGSLLGSSQLLNLQQNFVIDRDRELIQRQQLAVEQAQVALQRQQQTESLFLNQKMLAERERWAMQPDRDSLLLAQRNREESDLMHKLFSKLDIPELPLSGTMPPPPFVTQPQQVQAPVLLQEQATSPPSKSPQVHEPLAAPSIPTVSSTLWAVQGEKYQEPKTNVDIPKTSTATASSANGLFEGVASAPARHLYGLVNNLKSSSITNATSNFEALKTAAEKAQISLNERVGGAWKIGIKENRKQLITAVNFATSYLKDYAVQLNSAKNSIASKSTVPPSLSNTSSPIYAAKSSPDSTAAKRLPPSKVISKNVAVGRMIETNSRSCKLEEQLVDLITKLQSSSEDIQPSMLRSAIVEVQAALNEKTVDAYYVISRKVGRDKLERALSDAINFLKLYERSS